MALIIFHSLKECAGTIPDASHGNFNLLHRPPSVHQVRAMPKKFFDPFKNLGSQPSHVNLFLPLSPKRSGVSSKIFPTHALVKPR
jgi:hypothetical protein